MNITVVGHVCIDNNISEHITYTGAGSPAMFMTRIFNKLPQTKFKIIAPYGKDFLNYIKEIDIYPKKPTSDWTLIYENKSSGNIRSQKALNREYAKPQVIDVKLQKILMESDILFFAPLTPDYSSQYVKTLTKFTWPNTLKILLPQGYLRSFDKEDNVIERNFEESMLITSLFDFVIVSEQDHKNMKTMAENWAKKTRVIMTQGDQGSSYFYNGQSIFVSVKQVKPEDIIDSVGSGDIFAASFGYKYYLTKDINKSLEFANDIARQCLFYPADNLKFTLPQ